MWSRSHCSTIRTRKWFRWYEGSYSLFTTRLCLRMSEVTRIFYLYLQQWLEQRQCKRAFGHLSILEEFRNRFYICLLKVEVKYMWVISYTIKKKNWISCIHIPPYVQKHVHEYRTIHIYMHLYTLAWRWYEEVQQLVSIWMNKDLTSIHNFVLRDDLEWWD